MRIAISNHGRSAIIAMGLAIAGGLTGSARATVLEPTASLPLIGVAYISPTGAGYFNVGVCVTPGALIQTSATSKFLPPQGLLLPAVQDVVATATYFATLTLPPPSPDTPIGSVALHGTVDEEIVGRTSNMETGSWTVDITSLDLTGELVLPKTSKYNGDTLNVTLDTSNPSDTSSGTTTVTADGSVFKIDVSSTCLSTSRFRARRSASPTSASNL
jgi:hypothetical protein